MKLVIEIPEEYRSIFEENRCEEKFDSLASNEFGYVLRKAFENGTPLPKGHGRLKDIDEIDWYGCTTEYDCPYKNRDCKDCDRAECSKTQVDSIPVLIPADKEDAE